MFKLHMHKELRLPRPVGVDWFRPLGRRKLQLLVPGKFIWFVVDDQIQCAEVTHPSTRLDITTKPVLHGTQLYYLWKHDRTTHLAGPHLVHDGKEGEFYRIVDVHAAEEYYEKILTTPTEESSLKLVANNGGSG